MIDLPPASELQLDSLLENARYISHDFASVSGLQPDAVLTEIETSVRQMSAQDPLAAYMYLAHKAMTVLHAKGLGDPKIIPHCLNRQMV